YGDSDGIHAGRRIAEVARIIKKPGIKVEVSHELLSTDQIVGFLGENTINCYFYDQYEGAGVASAPDYALAARRPIAVTKSNQLSNFIGLSPSICIEDHSLKEIISFGLKPLDELHAASTEERVIEGYEEMLDQILHEHKARYSLGLLKRVLLQRA
ncbi:MAG: hypothetical protein K940chlam2_01170, partial [Chlamydiae bacterium]|nr:hypothetical protein [Chlamydiota bacterium]